VSKERFRIWIIVEIKEGDFYDLKDIQNKCSDFFAEFSREHLEGMEFEALMVGADYPKKTRDITYAKYFESVEEAQNILNILRKACRSYGDTIKLSNHKPFIEKAYLENKLQSLEYEITAYNLLKNF